MLTLLIGSVTAFMPLVGPTSRPAVNRPQMTLFQDPDMALYAASTGAGLAVTGILAPFVTGAFDSPPAAAVIEADGDVCELINNPPISSMPQPLYIEEEEEDNEWWVCAGQQLAENCQTVFHDDEYKVACAY